MGKTQLISSTDRPNRSYEHRQAILNDHYQTACPFAMFTELWKITMPKTKHMPNDTNLEKFCRWWLLRIILCLQSQECTLYSAVPCSPTMMVPLTVPLEKTKHRNLKSKNMWRQSSFACWFQREEKVMMEKPEKWDYRFFFWLIDCFKSS